MSEPAKDEAVSELVENVARYLFALEWSSQWAEATPDQQDSYREKACNTLAAIRAAGWAVVPVALLEEAASTLESLCDIEHIHRDKYPDEQRRYDRDMEFPKSIRAMLSAAPGVKP